jgi:two-component system response regulator YesN
LVRIVIVEDEPRIREGLARLIGKIKPEYRIVGEARDGLEGIRIISKLRPEVVVTDVRMPDLSGLEMLERLGDCSVKVKAIVLSAYSEFSYAREAIRLGVSEYLLKPINIGDLTRALKNVENLIESESLARRKEGASTLEGALYSIMLGGAKVDASLRSSISKDCGVETEGHFALATVYLGRRYETDAPRVIDLADATLSKRAGLHWRIIGLPRSNRFSIVMFNIGEVEPIRVWFCDCFMPRMREAGLPELCVGWGRFDDLGELRSAVLGIDEVLDWNIALDGGTMLVWPDVEFTQCAPLPYPIALENEVRASLCAIDRCRYESGISGFMRYLRSGKVYSPREIKNSFIRFFWSVLNTAREIDYEGYASLAQQEILERIRFALSWSELEEAVKILLRLFPRDKDSGSSDGFIIVRAKNIIREFYAQGITLNEVAAQIDVTPEYLSALFHRDTGTTFSAYIRDYRIQKAKELLISTNLRLYEIGEQAGYRDSKYFCRVFKEATGMRPSDFRKANR